MKIAILDDYQNVVLKMADWSPLSERGEITVFSDHVADPSALVERLLPFDVVCVMRERTPLPREVLQRLPRLKLIGRHADPACWSKAFREEREVISTQQQQATSAAGESLMLF